MASLKRLLTSRDSQIIINILLKGCLSLVIEAKEQKILAISEELNQLLDRKNLLDCPLSEIDHQISELAHGEKLRHLNKIRNQQLASSWFIILKKRQNSQLQLFELHDYPIFDNYEYVGSLLRLQEVNMKNNCRRYQFINTILGNNHEKSEHVQFSRLEYEILYLSAMGKSPKEIAALLEPIADRRISHSSISATINKRIYPKINTFSMSQTLEKAVLSGSITSFPQTFLELAKNKFMLIETTKNILSIG